MRRLHAGSPRGATQHWWATGQRFESATPVFKMGPRDVIGSLGRDAQMIRYRLDSWRCFGRNANGGLLIHAVDKSPEIGAAVIDDDVEGSARPWLILDAVSEALMQNAVAFNPIRIVVGAGQDLQQVHTADDTDHQLVLNDRHPLDAVLLHQVRDFPQRCFRLRRYHLTRHHIAYTFSVRLDELLRLRVA